MKPKPAKRERQASGRHEQFKSWPAHRQWGGALTQTQEVHRQTEKAIAPQ
jgi:hypothetical protein